MCGVGLSPLGSTRLILYKAPCPRLWTNLCCMTLALQLRDIMTLFCLSWIWYWGCLGWISIDPLLNQAKITSILQALWQQCNLWTFTRYHFRVQLQRNQSPVHSHVSHTLGTSVPQDRIAFNQPLLLLVCLHLHMKYDFRNHDAMSVVFLRKNFHSNARLAANMGLFLGTFQPWPETDLPSDDPIASLHCDQRAGNLSCSGFLRIN